jgi:hypothetical protein
VAAGGRIGRTNEAALKRAVFQFGVPPYRSHGETKLAEAESGLLISGAAESDRFCNLARLPDAPQRTPGG